MVESVVQGYQDRCVATKIGVNQWFKATKIGVWLNQWVKVTKIGVRLNQWFKATTCIKTFGML